MDKAELFNIRIEEPCLDAYKNAQIHWDGIAKPLDGLGVFEEIINKIAGITGNADVRIDKKAVVVMCADNGIIEEGVSQSGHEVTTVVSSNIAKGIASVCRMACVAGADVVPVDIGIKDNIEAEGLLDRKVSNGTANFAREPAITIEGLLQAIQTGIDITRDLKEKGYKIIATGEMGIGNTTTSSALASVMLNIPVSKVAGRGAGLSDEGLKRKISVIGDAIKKYGLDGQKENLREETFKALRCIGGLDIAGLAGVFIGGALYHIPVIVDGIISATAALAAERLVPGCRLYMIASHTGKEPACRFILDRLCLKPVIDAGLALGEGTGAVLLFPMLDMVMEVYRENTTFDDINITQYKRYTDI
ncbi:MAG: nicotinate-nucleotide--dimethylbenzimidazole phosphoribosyltransferase [Lachnospiraceae bacterium]|nr:nicotinate-nucleotide--dimethylbenzimidazole phosphoribosyltransferase [Lachnospiraceae bacterium]